jgi:hypothetical protein
MPTYFCFPPRIIRQKHMADENTTPPETGIQPDRAPQNSPAEGGQREGPAQGQQPRRDRDRSRHHGNRRDPHRRDQQQPPSQRPPQVKPSEGKEAETDIDAEEETEGDRSSPQNRQHHRRGGKPPKKIIEEWANDPYCE